MNNSINLTNSEVIYLFANKSVSERARLVNYDNHPSNNKISIKPLCLKMVVGALAYLVDNGYLTLSIKNVKKLIFLSSRQVFGKKIKEAGSDVTGIEKILLNNFKNESQVSTACYYLLDSDETSPWGQVVVISKNSLVEKGFLEIEKERKNIFSTKKYFYVENKLKHIDPVYNDTEKNIKLFSANKDIYRLVENAIKNGIGSRQEKSSNDD